MTQTRELHVNPSDETIRLGPLAVRFLITGEQANGSVAVFERSTSLPPTTGPQGRSARNDCRFQPCSFVARVDAAPLGRRI
jgi:hypothetical protein